MKTKFIAYLTVLVLLIVVLLPGCKRVSSSLNGSGKIVDQDLEIKEFTSINARGIYNLKIQAGEVHKVTVSLDDNLFKRIQVNIERKTLRLGIAAPATFFPTAFRVTITMPKLVGLNLSGGAKATIAGFSTPDVFTLFVSDKGLVEGSLVAGNLICNLSSGSKVILTGSGQNLELNSSGGSDLDLNQYYVERAQIRMEGASEAILNVSGQFDVDLRNKSRLFFSGNPVFTNTSVTGGSTMAMIQK